MHISRSSLVALMVLALFCFTASPLLAQAQLRYTAPSDHHTAHGVSQLLVGHTSGSGYYAKLSNPTPVTMIAALLLYDRGTGGSEGYGSFQDCQVVRLSPHESSSVEGVDVYLDTGYIEVLTVPESPIRIGRGRPTHIADGLGIVGSLSPSGGDNLFPINPALFSLPADSVERGQRQDAIDCISAALGSIDAPADVFQEFGIVGDSVIRLFPR
jgi:hypothetical protein